MAEPEVASQSRRAVRRRRRHRAMTAAAAVVGAVVLVAGVGAALVATDVVGLPGDSSAKADRVRTSDDGSGSRTPTDTPPASARRRALTGEDPLRLWIAGDSLAGSVGPSLGQMTAETGVVQPEYDSRVSSGLLNPGFFDWPEHAAEQLDLIDPEVVVFVIGTNDANAWSANLADKYRIQTESMMRLLAAEGREVYWVGPPVAKDDDLQEGVRAVDLIARRAAIAVPGITYVDAHSLFADSDGEYQYRFDNELGVEQVMRAGDGVHLSVDGADFLSRALFRLLDRVWHITDQARPDRPKRVRETEGSTQVEGTHRSVSVDTGSTTPSTGWSDDSDDGDGSGTTSTTATSSTTPTSSSTVVPSTTTTVATSTTTAPPGP